MHGFIPSIKITKSPFESLGNEIVRLFSTPTIFVDDDDNAFAWWATNYTHFKSIAFAAKDFLPISGCSVTTERAFSAAGSLITPFCTSLPHESIKAHVCL